MQIEGEDNMSDYAWKKENTKMFGFRLTKNIDQEMIDYIESQPSKNAYFRNLVEADMAKQKRAAKRAKKAEE